MPIQALSSVSSSIFLPIEESTRTLSRDISTLIAKIKAAFHRCFHWIVHTMQMLFRCRKINTQLPQVIVDQINIRRNKVITERMRMIERMTMIKGNFFDALADIPREIYESVQINKKKIGLAPPPIYPEEIQYIANRAIPPIRIREILDIFDISFAAVANSAVLFEVDNVDKFDRVARFITKERARERIELGFIGLIEDQNDNSRVKGISDYLKVIVFELRKQDLSLAKKQKYLTELSQAAGHCGPRLYDNVKKIYLTISQQIETLETIILRYFQEAKETLLLNYYYKSNEPVMTLNHIRSLVGAEFGLDIDPIHLNDPFKVRHHDARGDNSTRHTTAEQFKKTFWKICTPENIMRLIMRSLNNRIQSDNPFATEVTEFIRRSIQDHVLTGQLKDTAFEKLPAPYQNDTTYHLTPEGVRFLLCTFENFTPQQPNGHLVEVNV